MKSSERKVRRLDPNPLKAVDDRDAKSADEIAQDGDEHEDITDVLSPLEDWPACARCGCPRPIGVQHPKDRTGKLCWFCAEESCQGCGG